MDELASLEEAFRYQEMELQRERENANNLQIQMIKTQEERSKLDKQNNSLMQKLKKLTEIQN